jgi:hypothetical protein
MMDTEALTRTCTRRIWRLERNAQIDWMREQTLAGVYPGGPPTRPMPEMTVPPPFSPAWYRLPES